MSDYEMALVIADVARDGIVAVARGGQFRHVAEFWAMTHLRYEGKLYLSICITSSYISGRQVIRAVSNMLTDEGYITRVSGNCCLVLPKQAL
jgi:hypothetical protein